MIFPVQEYENRYRRACELMEDRDLNALLITEKSNYSYFTAHRTIGWATKTRPIIFILPLDGEPTLLVHGWETENAKRSCPWLKSIVKWVDLPFSVLPLAKIFKDLRLDSAKIGAELGYEQRINMPFNDFQELRQNLPKAELKDASGLLWELRMHKSPAEIALIKRSSEITSEAIEETFAKTKRGMSEREIGTILYTSMMEKGADRPGVAAICGGPESYPRQSQMPTDNVVTEGNILFVDTGCIYNDYWSDMSRAAVLGKASERQKTMHKIFQSATEKSIEMIEPGVKASEIASSCVNDMRKAGLKTWEVGRMGHGLGLDFTEPPSITLGDHTTLDDGMVLTVEPGLTEPSGIFCVEEVIVVRKGGCEVLTTAKKELQSI